jgi:lipid-A-disaccharide synthase
MSEISFRIARTLVKVNYAGLVNLIAGREVSPELLQEDASPERISEKVLELLGNPDSLEKMKADFRLVRKKLGKPGAAARAADIAVSMLGIRSMKNR